MVARRSRGGAGPGAGLVASKAPPDALERALERVERALAVLERRIEEW